MNAIQNISTKLLPWSLLLLLFLLLQSASAGTTETTWKKHEITIDGNFEDWTGIPNQFNEDLKLVYSVINDDSCLYFMFRFQDSRLARKINMNGGILWLNSNNKKNKDLGIRYFNEKRPRKPGLEADPDDMPEMRSREMDPIRGVVELNGEFRLKDENSSLQLSGTGITSVAAFQSDFYCFEYQIPLIEEDSEGIGLQLKPGEKFKIGIEIEAMSPELRAEIKERMKHRTPPEGDRHGGGMRGGMGGGRGGRMRGGPPRMERGEPLKMMENEEIWFDLKLTKPTQN